MTGTKLCAGGLGYRRVFTATNADSSALEAVAYGSRVYNRPLARM
jgi:hypothetical protein